MTFAKAVRELENLGAYDVRKIGRFTISFWLPLVSDSRIVGDPRDLLAEIIAKQQEATP